MSTTKGKSSRATLYLLSLLFIQLPALVQADNSYLSELARLDIGGLMSQEVSSVLRKDEPVLSAPSAVFVLTNEMIRRSGARSIPEALRLVPEVTVLRTSSSGWLITARGIDANGSAKLLVLIDGRTVYSPLFSNVFWDVQDLMLNDVDRIEVIRGPGAVSWGENAVNGVINIITKSAKDTQGGLITGGGGKEEEGFSSVRYGGKVGEDTAYRIWAKYNQRDTFKTRDGLDARDDWYTMRSGFRFDSDVTPNDLVTFQGDIYQGKRHSRVNSLLAVTSPDDVTEAEVGGGNVVLRWDKKLEDSSSIRFQTYYDHTGRSTDPFGEDRDTYDVDVQHHFHYGTRHDIVWGGDFRVSSDELQESPVVQVESNSRTDTIENVFLQDDITIIPQRFRLIPGIKLGYSDLGDFSEQPSIRFVYTPDESSSFWGAISKAVRSPARLDKDLRINTNPVVQNGQLTVVSLLGNPQFNSESLVAYELGYRQLVTESFSFDIATFYHHYDDLLSAEPGTPFFEEELAPPHLVVPFVLGNGLHGDAYGTGTYARWKVSDYLDLGASYSYIMINFEHDPDSNDTLSSAVERETPHNQANFSAHLQLPNNFEFDSLLYYMDSMPAVDVSSHLRTDFRLGWKANENLGLEFVVQDLFDDRHRERSDIEIERAYYGRLTYRFK